MKIIFFANGKSVHTIRWVNAMAARTHDVYLLCLSDDMPEQDDLLDSVNVVKLPFSKMKGSGYYFNVPFARSVIKKINPDIVNAHYASGYGTLARLSRVHPIILSVWGSDVYVFPYLNKWKRSLVIKNLMYADVVASTSEVMGKQVQTLCANAEYSVTPFGVNIDTFNLLKRDYIDSVVTFGIVKSLDKIYRIDVLLDAFAILKKATECPVKLLIYGKGPERECLVNQTKKLGIEKDVAFMGFIPNSEVPEALSKMDIFVLSSESESFGVAAIEAMAVGLPVIATDADGFIEVIDDGVTGIIVPRNDPEEMARKMLFLLENAETREQLGKAGRIRVEEFYDFEKNVLVMEELYEKTKRIFCEKQ